MSYLLNVPEKRTGSCGMIDTLDRNVSKVILPVFTPSIRISPSTHASLKMVPINEDFPAPVRPTIPTFSFPSTTRFTPLNTGSASAKYL